MLDCVPPTPIVTITKAVSFPAPWWGMNGACCSHLPGVPSPCPNLYPGCHHPPALGCSLGATITCSGFPEGLGCPMALGEGVIAALFEA